MLLKRHAAFVFVALLFACTSCNNMVFPVASPAKASWKATVSYDETIPFETREKINAEFDEFLKDANMSVVKFSKVTDTTDADMIISIKDFKPVTPNKQIAGAAVSFVGLFVTPLALSAATDGAFYIVFWYFPKSKSTATMYVRDGEGNSHVRKKTYLLHGPGFLKKLSTQNRKHSKAYRKYFRKVLKYYNQQILDAKKKGLATTP